MLLMSGARIHLHVLGGACGTKATERTVGIEYDRNCTVRRARKASDLEIRSGPENFYVDGRNISGRQAVLRMKLIKASNSEVAYGIMLQACSENSTYVNDNCVELNEEVNVKVGDHIRFGSREADEEMMGYVTYKVAGIDYEEGQIRPNGVEIESNLSGNNTENELGMNVENQDSTENDEEVKVPEATNEEDASESSWTDYEKCSVSSITSTDESTGTCYVNDKVVDPIGFQDDGKGDTGGNLGILKSLYPLLTHVLRKIKMDQITRLDIMNDRMGTGTDTKLSGTMEATPLQENGKVQINLQVVGDLKNIRTRNDTANQGENWLALTTNDGHIGAQEVTEVGKKEVKLIKGKRKWEEEEKKEKGKKRRRTTLNTQEIKEGQVYGIAAVSAMVGAIAGGVSVLIATRWYDGTGFST